MVKRAYVLPACLLMVAAVTFWLSWFLMPDQGTADTLHILSIVKENRQSVLWSVVLQIISSILYIPALFLLSNNAASAGTPITKLSLCGIVLLAIGAMGMCADAFFHLLAYFMTDDAVTIQEDIIQVMTFMQTQGILFLAPVLLPFFIGSLLLSLGLYKQHLSSPFPLIIVLVAFGMAITGGIIVRQVLGYGRPMLVLTVLGLFAQAQIVMGADLLSAHKRKKRLQTVCLQK